MLARVTVADANRQGLVDSMSRAEGDFKGER